MPGLLGLLSPDKQKINSDFMIQSLDHYGYEHAIHRQDELLLGHVYLRHQVPFRTSGMVGGSHHIFMLHGEIFSYDNEDIPSDSRPDMFLFEKFRQEGYDFVQKLNGHFQLCIYDESKKVLHLMTDRFGTLPLYYTLYKNEFVFAPEIKAVLQNKEFKREIDFHAVSELFHFNHIFGYKTLIKDICQLPAAAHLTFKDNSYSVKQYWEYPYNQSAYMDRKISPSAIADAENRLERLMVQAFERQTKTGTDNLLIPLSGGLDSRWMVALANEAGLDPIESFTMGPEESEDVKYARLVARQLNINHKIFEISSGEIWQDADRFCEAGGGMQVIYGPIQNFNPYRHYYRQSQIVIMPQMCDILFGSSLYRRQLKTLMSKSNWDAPTENLFTEHFNLIPEADLKLILHPGNNDQILNAYRIVPQQYIERDKNPMYCYFRILMNEHGRRGTLGGNVATNLFFTTRMPSYDNDLVEFAFNLPLSLKINQNLYRRTFSKRFPGLAAIPRQGTNLPIDVSDFRFNINQLEGRLINRIKDTRLKNVVGKFARWNRPNYVSYAEWFRTDLKNNIEDLVLDPVLLDRGLYKKEGLQKLLADHFTGHRDHNRIIWQIINLELFMRKFID